LGVSGRPLNSSPKRPGPHWVEAFIHGSWVYEPRLRKGKGYAELQSEQAKVLRDLHVIITL
jgi:hypothetical protein